MLNYKLFLEANEYKIDLENLKNNTYQIDKSNLNRLKHLIYNLEKSGSFLQGEKISEILLGATNLNTLDLSYPFVDLKVIEPVKDISILNELISIKTTRDKHSLREAVTYVNGFKIGQLIQFAISNMNFNFYKKQNFKQRYAYKLSSVTSHYDKFIKQYFGENKEIYTFIFVHTLLFYSLFKNYLDIVSEEIFLNRNDLYLSMEIFICKFIDEFNGTKYLEKYKSDNIKKINKINKIDNDIEKKYMDKIRKSVDYKDDYKWLDFIDEEIRNLQISYAILYFTEDDDKIILNLHKTQNVSFDTLLKNTIETWTSSEKHMKSLNSEKNIYLDYGGVIKAFSNDKLQGDDVFNTHIQVEFTEKFVSEYKERPEETKKLYVKVIDKIKSIPNDEKQEQILNLINKFLTKMIDEDDEKVRNRYINKFSEMFL